MCAVIGVSNDNVTDLDLIKRVFRESEIRGLHATGVTYFKEGKLHTIKDTIKGSEFFDKYSLEDMLDGTSLKLIGHCRYSTSDLEFNQPMESPDFSVVHNGVITQEPAELWKELYGVETRTRNDSELLLKYLTHECISWPNASIAYVSLNSAGQMHAYRNGKRPLHISMADNGFLVTSTEDIAKRAGVEVSVNAHINGTYHFENGGVRVEYEESMKPDLQRTF